MHNYIIVWLCFIDGSDYENGPYSVDINPGTTEVSFNITIIVDNLYEESEHFTVYVDNTSLPSGVICGDSCEATVNITDKDEYSK